MAELVSALSALATTIRPVTIRQIQSYKQFFSCDDNFSDLFSSQLSNMQYSITD